MAGGIGGWVDTRIRNAIDHLVDQVDTPDSPAAKAVGVLADKIGDRVDQSLDRIPGLVDRTGDAIRADVQQGVADMANQVPALANRIVEGMRNVLPGDLWGRLDNLLGGRRMGVEREPEERPGG